MRHAAISALRCCNEVYQNLTSVANEHSAETLRRAGEVHAMLHFSRMEAITAGGLPRFFEDFLVRGCADLGARIASDFCCCLSGGVTVMQMHIRHETRYRYERPVKYSVQSLHLTPRRDLSQRALTWTITAPGRRLEQVDAHGNITHLLTIEEPHREIQIVVRGVVETVDVEGRSGTTDCSRQAARVPRLDSADRGQRRAAARLRRAPWTA